ncbi:MAG: hypothetical protein HY904_25580 [Deltaproteobacteria bacterium]|nr:hypothetical protein [Deltaproteobacteria bacterium]
MTRLAALLGVAVFAAGAAEMNVVVEGRAEQGLLQLNVPTPGIATSSFRSRLQDGLTHRIRYTLTLRQEGQDTVLLTEVLQSEVVYDLWDEVFVVTHAEAGRVRRSRVKTVDKVTALLEKPRFRTAVPVRTLPPGRLVVEVRAEVNPVSEEVLNRTRQMLSPPPSDAENRAARGLLGSVARIFVNESSASGGAEAFLYRGAPFVVVTGGAP